MTWLRTHALSLGALLLAAIAVAGAYLWLDLLPVGERMRTTIIAAEESVELYGQQLTYESAEWDEVPAPEGSRTLSIRLRSSGGADAETCRDFVLTELDSERSWLDARNDLDVEYGDAEPYCRPESTPYEILAVFLVPDDADGPFVFDIPGDGRTVSRFTVDP